VLYLGIRWHRGRILFASKGENKIVQRNKSILRQIYKTFMTQGDPISMKIQKYFHTKRGFLYSFLDESQTLNIYLHNLSHMKVRFGISIGEEVVKALDEAIENKGRFANRSQAIEYCVRQVLELEKHKKGGIELLIDLLEVMEKQPEVGELIRKTLKGVSEGGVEARTQLKALAEKYQDFFAEEEASLDEPIRSMIKFVKEEIG